MSLADAVASLLSTHLPDVLSNLPGDEKHFQKACTEVRLYDFMLPFAAPSVSYVSSSQAVLPHL